MRALGLVLGLAIVTAFGVAPAARAADRTFTLYGAASGWGETNTTLANPGPTLTVNQGDNVTLILNSTDGPNHNWFVDYDNDGNDDPTEPNSPNFQSTEIQWNFTADRNGTFTYRCKFHPTEMTGSLVVQVPGGPPPEAPAGDNTALLVGVGIVGILAILGVVFLLMKRKR